MPNRNDNGTLNPGVTGRLVTGLLAPRAGNPQIYVVSSDPRIGAPRAPTSTSTPTRHPVAPRTAGGWTKADLVRGLPRSEENHTGNGLAIDPASGRLPSPTAAHEQGAPSHNFAGLPEYALSAAVLSVDLGALGGAVRPAHPRRRGPTGTADANDPFGGNDGQNQAAGARWAGADPRRRVPQPLRPRGQRVGRPVHDRQRRQRGLGAAPQPDGPAGTCTNALVETSDTDADVDPHPGPGVLRRPPQPDQGQPGQHVQRQQPPVARRRRPPCRM